MFRRLQGKRPTRIKGKPGKEQFSVSAASAFELRRASVSRATWGLALCFPFAKASTAAPRATP